MGSRGYSNVLVMAKLESRGFLVTQTLNTIFLYIASRLHDCPETKLS